MWLKIILYRVVIERTFTILFLMSSVIPNIPCCIRSVSVSQIFKVLVGKQYNFFQTHILYKVTYEKNELCNMLWYPALIFRQSWSYGYNYWQTKTNSTTISSFSFSYKKKKKKITGVHERCMSQSYSENCSYLKNSPMEIPSVQDRITQLLECKGMSPITQII